MGENGALRCVKCDRIIMWDGSRIFCRRHYAIRKLRTETGLDVSDLPDSLPIEDFIDEDGELDYDGISAW